MNIIRYSKPSVTCIDNAAINDPALSAELLGYLTFIHSLPDPEINAGDLASRFRISINAAHQIITMLTLMGHLKED